MSTSTLPWYRQVSSQQWKAFSITFFAWVLDSFDFTILTFVLADIQQSFSVNKALAVLLGTVTLLFRVVGGIGAGTAADKWGRKGPILFSIAWYTLFALLSGASTSYTMLFAFRGLFGIGMGGMWAAGMPLALEHWPQHLRGIASGILQGGYSTGFLLSSIVFQFGYPLVSHRPEIAWRVMTWAGVLPAFITLLLMWKVPESPIWLEQQRKRVAEGGRQRLSLARLFDRDLFAVTIHTSLLMGAFVSMYQSTTFWYPTLLAQKHLPPLWYMVALNAGGAIGSLSVQIAKHFGAEVAATTRGANADYVKALGADHVIAYDREDFTHRLADYDVVYDLVGGDVHRRSYRVLKRGGTLVWLIAEPIEDLSAEYGVILKQAKIHDRIETLENVLALAGKGVLKPQVGAVFPLAAAADAHRLVESGAHTRGRVVLQVR